MIDEQTRTLAFTRILDACDYIEAMGLKQTSLRRRDKREPGRRRKEEVEDKLYAASMRHFRRQKSAIQERLELYYPNRKTIIPLDDILGDDEEFIADFYRIISAAVVDGIRLFDENDNMTIDYTAVNSEALEWARKYSGDLVTNIDQTTRDSVNKAVSAFVETPGMTLRDVMNQLPFTENRALMIAVTETTNAYAQGNQMAGVALKKEFPGVRVVKIWYTAEDDRVCEICGPLAGVEVEVEEEFAPGIDNPAAHVNCLTGNALVHPVGGIIAGTERWYQGNIITIETLENRLTITPNHPILTPTGWVAAGKLAKGNDILGYNSGEWKASFIAGYNQNMISAIKDIFRSLGVNGFWMPTSSPDFHGDGANSKIAIIRPNSQIANIIYSQFIQPLSESQFQLRESILDIILTTMSAEAQFVKRDHAPTSRFMSSPNLSLPGLRSHSRPFSNFGLGLRTRPDVSIQHHSPEGAATNSELLRKCIFALPGNIAMQKIINIRNEQFSGHVYNLQTETGLFIADGIITHNCRCSTTVTTKLTETD